LEHSTTNKWQNNLIIAANLLFLLLFFVLSYFNRFAVDDYYHIHDEHVFGIWGGMLEGYYHWGGRWTSYLLWDLLYHFHEYPLSLFLYSFSIVVCFILAVDILLQRIFDFFEIAANKILILNYSILFTVFTFFISYSKGEIWFWAQSSAMFMFSIIAFLFGLGIIVGIRSKFHHFLLLAICFTYAGGASETYALFYLLFLLSSCFCMIFVRQNPLISKLKEKTFYKILFSLTFLIASFIISVKAPGNAIRATWLPEPSFSNSFFITFKSLIKLIIYKLPIQLLWIKLFSIPCIYIGYLIGKGQQKLPYSYYYKKLFISLLLLVILVYILIFPSCYVLSEIGPDRSLSQVVLVIAIFCSSWAFIFGYRCVKTAGLLRYFSYCALSVIIVFLIVINIMQFQTVSAYATGLDKRTSDLMKLKQQNNSKTIALKALPPSGFLYSAEISPDTSYFSNEHYRLGLFLDFKVRQETKPSLPAGR
jgi:hypothetical protein